MQEIGFYLKYDKTLILVNLIHINVGGRFKMQSPTDEEIVDDTVNERSKYVASILILFQQIGNYIFSILQIVCIPFKDFFASVQRASKRDNNNRTPGEGTCFELGKSKCESIQIVK